MVFRPNWRNSAFFPTYSLTLVDLCKLFGCVSWLGYPRKHRRSERICGKNGTDRILTCYVDLALAAPDNTICVVGNTYEQKDTKIYLYMLRNFACLELFGG